jgi:predicted nucleic acid-binding protein
VTTLSGVLDTNIIIGLVKGECFEQLAFLFSPLYIPPGVRAEVFGQDPARAGVAELSQALGSWVSEEVPDPALVQALPTKLSVEDREVIALAQEKGVHFILSSDEALRKTALGLGINCLRATEVVVLLKRRKLIGSAKAILDLMRQRGFGIRDDLYQEALTAAGELP